MRSPATLNIVMVDDDREDAFLMRRALSKLNVAIHFDHVSDSAKFVEALGNQTSKQPQNADIILLDINMPRVNGFEVLKTLRAHAHFVKSKVVMLTTSDAQEDKDEAMRLGANSFLSKPSTTLGLQHFVEELVMQATRPGS